MYQFFVEEEKVTKDFIIIEGADVNHIKNVLRMKNGEKIRICTKNGQIFLCEIAQMTDSFVRADILEREIEKTELPNRIYLFQGLPKNDKMEWIIQKAVELGVYEVIPVSMKNCVVRLDEKKAKAKVTRWQTIAESAAKQSKRSLIPNIRMPMSYTEAVSFADTLDVKLLPYENEHGMEKTIHAMETIKLGQSVAIFIGPEGGFSEEEIAMVKDKMQLISLGKRILRTETAAIFALAVVGYQLEQKSVQ